MPAPLTAAAYSSGRQALLGGDRPEVAALDAAPVELAGRREPPRDLERAVPGARPVQRRPRVRAGPRQPERVEHERLAERPPAVDGRPEQVGLDRGGDRGAVPLEQRRDRDAGRLARLRRAERDQRVPVLGVQQPRPRRPSTRRPCARAPEAPQRAQLGGPRPPRSCAAREPGRDRAARPASRSSQPRGRRRQGSRASRRSRPRPAAPDGRPPATRPPGPTAATADGPAPRAAAPCPTRGQPEPNSAPARPPHSHSVRPRRPRRRSRPASRCRDRLRWLIRARASRRSPASPCRCS